MTDQGEETKMKVLLSSSREWFLVIFCTSGLTTSFVIYTGALFSQPNTTISLRLAIRGLFCEASVVKLDLETVF